MLYVYNIACVLYLVLSVCSRMRMSVRFLKISRFPEFPELKLPELYNRRIGGSKKAAATTRIKLHFFSTVKISGIVDNLLISISFLIPAARRRYAKAKRHTPKNSTYERYFRHSALVAKKCRKEASENALQVQVEQAMVPGRPHSSKQSAGARIRKN